MRKNLFSAILPMKSAEESKAKLRVYKFQGTYTKEFSSMDEAKDYAKSAAKKYPGLLFEPYVERRNSGDRRRGMDRRAGKERRSGTERRNAPAR
ncbi:MAG: hypothetical protein R6V46_15255 [Desulfatiglandaceae bacterium]